MSKKYFRNISKSRAKKEILECIQTFPGIYTSKIIENLMINPGVASEALEELEKSGELESKAVSSLELSSRKQVLTSFMFAKLAAYIAENSGKIAVRVQKDGKWGSYFLTELPPKQAIEEAMKFIINENIPVIVKSDKDEEHTGKSD